MKTVAFYDTKPYDRLSFERANADRYTFRFFDSKLTRDTAPLAEGCDAVCAFVNDTLDAETITSLASRGIRVIAMRCAGYNNVDFKTAFDRQITVLRVPAYSPYAVAEHAMALLLTLNRKLHKAYARTRDYNFSLNGLTGFDLHGKTVGIIGTGKIGRVFADICRGFGMRILGYDAYPATDAGITYVPLDTLLAESDVISLHCPLTPQTQHMVNADFLKKVKRGVYLINTSRGALVDSIMLLQGLRDGTIGAAGLDVYEEESEWFFEDRSDATRQNEILSLLVALPNVLVTSHQAFLTAEALTNIAETTLANLDAYFSGGALANEICYRCLGAPGNTKPSGCSARANGRCF